MFVQILPELNIFLIAARPLPVCAVTSYLINNLVYQESLFPFAQLRQSLMLIRDSPTAQKLCQLDITRSRSGLK